MRGACYPAGTEPSRWLGVTLSLSCTLTRVPRPGCVVRPALAHAVACLCTMPCAVGRAEAVWAELDTIWDPLCHPDAAWEGDEQRARTAQASLLFKAIVYQLAHNRLASDSQVRTRAVSRSSGQRSWHCATWHACVCTRLDRDCGCSPGPRCCHFHSRCAHAEAGLSQLRLTCARCVLPVFAPRTSCDVGWWRAPG